MNEKINVLGVNIDSFTAKEAMKETIAFLESEPVSVIDVVSVDALMQMNDLPELKEKMNEFDMILPGEKLILEAAEEPELPEEINMELYLKMFMRYLHKNHKRLYLLVESEEEGQEAFRYLQKAYSGVQLVGLAKVSAEGRADDMLVNAINGSEVDCVLSALSVPLQEDFIAKNRNLLDARVWIGVGKKIFSPRKPGFGQGKIAKYLLNHIFRREMEKNKLKMKSEEKYKKVISSLCLCNKYVQNVKKLRKSPKKCDFLFIFLVIYIKIRFDDMYFVDYCSEFVV